MSSKLISSPSLSVLISNEDYLQADDNLSMNNYLSELSKINQKVKPALNRQQEIKTILRIRPCPKGDEEGEYRLKDGKILEVSIGNMMKSFSFSKAFGMEVCQGDFFKNTCIEALDEFITNNKDGLIFTYGMTCSGKTFTIVGNDEEPGILPRSVLYILDKANKCRFPYSYICNYYEIYNEECYDLLSEYNTYQQSMSTQLGRTKKNKPKKEKLIIKEINKQIVFPHISHIPIQTYNDLLSILKYGNLHKTHSFTLLNEHSSRSHTIFKITKIDCSINNTPLSSFSIVDLAGSERAKRTETSGVSLVEAGKINLSLSVLGKCLEAMRQNSFYRNKKKTLVPFRESKLTQVFQEYFHGGYGITLITNINPRKDDYDESIRALGFSCICKEIQTTKAIPVSIYKPKYSSQIGKKLNPTILKSNKTSILNSNNDDLDYSQTDFGDSFIKIKSDLKPKGDIDFPSNFDLNQTKDEEFSMLKDENLKIKCELKEMKRKLASITCRAKSIDLKNRSLFLGDEYGINQLCDTFNSEANAEERVNCNEEVFIKNMNLNNKSDLKAIFGKFNKGKNIIMINPVIESINLGTSRQIKKNVSLK